MTSSNRPAANHKYSTIVSEELYFEDDTLTRSYYDVMNTEEKENSHQNDLEHQSCNSADPGNNSADLESQLSEDTALINNGNHNNADQINNINAQNQNLRRNHILFGLSMFVILLLIILTGCVIIGMTLRGKKEKFQKLHFLSTQSSINIFEDNR